MTPWELFLLCPVFPPSNTSGRFQPADVSLSTMIAFLQAAAINCQSLEFYLLLTYFPPPPPQNALTITDRPLSDENTHLSDLFSNSSSRFTTPSYLRYFLGVVELAVFSLLHWSFHLRLSLPEKAEYPHWLISEFSCSVWYFLVNVIVLVCLMTTCRSSGVSFSSRIS